MRMKLGWFETLSVAQDVFVDLVSHVDFLDVN